MRIAKLGNAESVCYRYQAILSSNHALFSLDACLIALAIHSDYSFDQ